MSSPIRPPKISILIIKKLCKEHLAEELIGNLYEYYNLEHETNSAFRLHVKYWFQVFSYLRLSTLKTPFKKLTHSYMFHFNILLTFRNLWKYKVSSSINILGFSIGLVSVTLLFFYIDGELSYDSFHQNGDKIYRVIRQSEINNAGYDIGVTSGPYANALKVDYEGIVEETLRVGLDQGLIRYKDQVYQEDNVLVADLNFFEFFSYPLLVGDKKTVLELPNSIVISESIAKKYFGDKNPLGELLEIDNSSDFQVTGIMGELPAKSHLKFDFIVPMSIYEKQSWMKNWWSNGLCTYVKIDSEENANILKGMLPDFMDKYFAKDFERSGNKMGLTIEPLSGIYFSNKTRFDPVLHGNKNTIYILGLVALAILIIASSNYVNLTIAAAFRRAKEIGVRKVLGSNRSRLILQFIGESISIVFLALLISIVASEALLPFFNGLFDVDVEFNWLDGRVLSFISILLLVTIILSGLYPALLLSSFQPIKALKGKILSNGNKLPLRQGLVIAQFVIAIFMIISTVLISSQLEYLNDKDLGFEKESVLLVRLDNNDIRQKMELFKDELLRDPNVLTVSQMSGEPGGFHDGTRVEIVETGDMEKLRTVFTDYDYLNVFDIKLITGRNFSETYSTDYNRAAILNKKAVKELGWTEEEIVGKKIFLSMFDSLDRTVVGVADNFHFLSLKDKIEPLAILLGGRPRTFAIRVKDKTLAAGIHSVHKIWDELAPKFPFSYKVLDEKISSLYSNESRQNRIFIAFSGVSIFLACLGIFGLVAHTTSERRKEFGIRKVLGAGIDQILILISRDFFKMIGIAYIFALPFSWYFMNFWLAEFEYRIFLSDFWYVFILGGIVAFVVSLITIAIRSIKTATSNPVDSLRYE